MIIIGLTGGIASGKSVVCRYLSRCGIPVVDADDISRALMEKGEDGWEKTLESFGEEILDADGRVDRRLLSDIVFRDDGLLEKLERIIHPLIVDRILKELGDLFEKDRDSVVVIDIPLLFERVNPGVFDGIVVVACDGAKQIERLKRFRGVSTTLAKMIIARQLPLGEKVRRADWVIENNGSVEELEPLVRGLAEKLCAMTGEDGKRTHNWRNPKSWVPEGGMIC